jgi:hypothetical protein
MCTVTLIVQLSFVNRGMCQQDSKSKGSSGGPRRFKKPGQIYLKPHFSNKFIIQSQKIQGIAHWYGLICKVHVYNITKPFLLREHLRTTTFVLKYKIV